MAALLETSGILTFDHWKNTLARITDFVKEHGRLPTKYNGNDSETKLAHWRHHNVSLYNRGLLSKERATLIEASGVQCNEDDKIWLDLYERAKSFYEMNGRYPSRFGNSDEEKKIGRWRSEQATLLRKNRLQPDRKQLFENAGLSKFIVEQKWNETLKNVVQFEKKYGRMPHPDGHEPDEAQLASWCQRNNLAIEIKSPVNKQRARLFKAAGIAESLRKDDPWEIQYKKLIAFCEEHSRLPLHGSKKPEKNLYQWYFDQLTRINKGRLDSDKADRIKVIKKTMPTPGEVAREKIWMEQYRKVSDFVHEYKRLPGSSPKKVYECKLYCWLQEQKKAVKKVILIRNI